MIELALALSLFSAAAPEIEAISDPITTEVGAPTHAGPALSVGPSIGAVGVLGAVVSFWPAEWLSIDALYAHAIFFDFAQIGVTYDHALHNSAYGRHALLLRAAGGAMRDLHALDGLFPALLGLPPGETPAPSFHSLTGVAAAGYGYRLGYFDSRVLAGWRLIGPDRLNEAQWVPDVMLSLSLYLPIH